MENLDNMENIEKNTNTKNKKGVWLKRIWGAFPSFLLICLIAVSFVFFNKISIKSAVLKAEKKERLAKQKPDVNVVTLKLNPTKIRDIINLPGVVMPWIELKVLCEVRGKVIHKKVEEGSKVRKGHIIAILDSRDYQNAFQSSKASYDAALSSLNRLKELYNKRLSTRSQLDNATAEVENFKAAMDNAALNLERCKVRAPISGIINHLYFERGKYLNASDPVADIIQINKVKVRVGIPESDVDAVRKLKHFNVKIDALGGKIFKGTTNFLSNTADDYARLYNLDLMLKNKNNEIMPDMFARVEIVKKEVLDGISVPLYSVISRDNEHIVFVEEQGIVGLRHVELGMQEAWKIEVTKGLKQGEHVVVVGQRSINEGQKINVVKIVNNIKELEN